MLNVDQRGVGGIGAVIPLPGRLFAARILCRRDDFEILVLQFRVQFLPAWQIQPAASPGGPCYHQYLLAAKVG
jgi:hypothetical protein